MTRVKQSDIDAIVDGDQSGITLNGNPACVRGRLHSCAIVGDLHGPLSVEFSWQAVVRILANGKHFKVL